MFKISMPALALCGTLLTTSDQPAAPWALQCQPNAVRCQVLQIVTSVDKPDAEWVAVSVFRKGEDLLLAIVTPPLAQKRIHLTVDRRIEVSREASGCTQEACTFFQMVDPPVKRVLYDSQTLQIEMYFTPEKPTALSVDLRSLKDYVEKIPLEL